MAARHLLLLWLALAAAQCGGASIWGWLLPSWAGGGDAGDGSGSARLAHAPGVDVPEVHFETKSVEDKFIDAVRRYEGRVSDLDACQHKPFRPEFSDLDYADVDYRSYGPINYKKASIEAAERKKEESQAKTKQQENGSQAEDLL